jgi:3-dehydroquinate synthase
MFRLKIHKSRIAVGETYRNLAKYLPKSKQVIIITDANILTHYGEFFRSFPVIETGIGEKAKTLDSVSHIYSRLLEHGVDRNSFIVAVGGGAVCDVAGFAASTFMRGIHFGFVSTTLLSQVDASVGGKNGVNFGGYKNIIGTFNQPDFVLCDISMLQTLPEREYISGFAEIVKAAIICNAGLFDYLEQNAEKALMHDDRVMHHLITEAVKIKANVVRRDEHEHGERRILNFGHTFGHAVEALTGITHGEAVSIGMIAAARYSIAECGFPQSQFDRLERLLSRLGLPVSADVQPDRIMDMLMKDKKRENSDIYFVLLIDTGKAAIQKMRIEDISLNMLNTVQK